MLTGYKTALQLLRAPAKRCSTCQGPSRSEVQRVPQSPPKRRGMLQIVFARLPAVQTFSTVIFFFYYCCLITFMVFVYQIYPEK